MRLQQLQQKHLIKLVPLGAVNLQIFSAIMRTASEKLCGESCKQFKIVNYDSAVVLYVMF